MKKVFLLAALAFVSDASIAQNIDTTKREVFFLQENKLTRIIINKDFNIMKIGLKRCLLV
ncbi:MAG: hypothetical protein ACKO03_09260 [Bacteroidota bacterium]